jgi:hypothetical protein
MANTRKIKVSVDDELTERLTVAEDALIGAVKLFSDHPTLSRRSGYYTRLIRAQELITGLRGEELVRQRGSYGSRKRK